MFDPFVKGANKSLELQPTYAAAAPDSDSENDKHPPLPDSPYRPYAEKPALSEPPYQPYADDSSLNETPYEPYAKKPVLLEPPYEPYKGI